MTLEWSSLVSEPGEWSTDGHGTWFAVWPTALGFGAWTSYPFGRKTSRHPTETSAKAWCEVRAAYRDDAFPERSCDRCGTSYRGPAVYCSLDCAVADA